ncbi:MAG: hypothetical protein MI725_01380 [Pirellulales bacterium]|nr:hypothetical protein [Pirellulales bacterium]
MDTGEYPSLPNLAQIHARLAANSRRVETAVDAQLSGIERLLSATIAEDWDAVAQTSRYLASQNPEEVSGDIIREARFVCDELSRSPQMTKKPKHLAKLLAACQAAKSAPFRQKGSTRAQ